jgi:hypothetical protein
MLQHHSHLALKKSLSKLSIVLLRGDVKITKDDNKNYLVEIKVES